MVIHYCYCCVLAALWRLNGCTNARETAVLGAGNPIHDYNTARVHTYIRVYIHMLYSRTHTHTHTHTHIHRLILAKQTLQKTHTQKERKKIQECGAVAGCGSQWVVLALSLCPRICFTTYGSAPNRRGRGASHYRVWKHHHRTKFNTNSDAEGLFIHSPRPARCAS